MVSDRFGISSNFILLLLTTLKPLSLLLKLSPLIDELSLYDVVNTPGVAADLSHIASKATVSGFLPPDDGGKASFKDADIIVIPAGIPRKHHDNIEPFLGLHRLPSSRQARHDAR